MIALWKAASIRVFDLLLGWLLWLPRDASVVLLAVFSALLAVGIRHWVCDRGLLGLIRQDERTLRRLIREARRAGDRAAGARHRRVRAAVIRLRLAQELRALAVMAVPLLTLIPWASARMDYLPPRGDEPVNLSGCAGTARVAGAESSKPQRGETRVGDSAGASKTQPQPPRPPIITNPCRLELIAWLPASAIGELIHLVPDPGLQAADGWIRPIAAAQFDGQTRGRAAWRIRAASRASPYRLRLRFRDRTLEHDVLVGQATYTAPVQRHGDEVATELRLRRYLPLGISRTANFGVAPWLMGYLVATLAAVLVLGPAFIALRSRGASAGGRRARQPCTSSPTEH